MRPASAIMGVPADSCKGERMGAVLLWLLGPDGQPIAVPIQDLDAIAPSIEEDEEVSREGIELEGTGRQRGQAVKTLAHVGGFSGEIDPDGGAQSEHRRSSTKSMS